MVRANQSIPGILRLLVHEYNFAVARGWESKSVEDQQVEAASRVAKTQPPLTPGQIAAQQQKQGLMLSRRRVLQQLQAAQKPQHRQMLERALADLDAQLTRLE